jgi:hypothetical protein
MGEKGADKAKQDQKSQVTIEDLPVNEAHQDKVKGGGDFDGDGRADIAVFVPTTSPSSSTPRR